MSVEKIILHIVTYNISSTVLKMNREKARGKHNTLKC